MNRKKICIILILSLILSFVLGAVCSFAAEETISNSIKATKNDIVVLYTNDIHSYINNVIEDKETGVKSLGLSYENVAALKSDIERNETSNVILLDAGDHIQGTAYGSIDKGMSIVTIMESCGYNAATIGNHEFDYGMNALEHIINTVRYPYLSCNFMSLITNQTALDPYKLFDFGDKKLAVVGVSAPETYTSTTPKHFEDENGNKIYDFLNSDDGSLLYNAVQNAIDSARTEGADYVIALAHLGVDERTIPHRSIDLINNTSGLTVVIDGHSHTEIEENYSDKDGNNVLLVQTGNYFSKVGKLIIDANGSISNAFISEYEGFDPDIRELKENLIDRVDELHGAKIAVSAIDLRINDNDGNRIVRRMESSMGDFVADAYYYYLNEIDGMNCDVAITNGGGVRKDMSAGDITYMDVKNVSPFSNVICLIKVTGQQLLDLFEWGSRMTDGTVEGPELGGFMQVAGVSFIIDKSVESTVQVKDSEYWGGGPTGEYRVKELKIFNKEKNCYEPVELEKEYSIAGINYTLRNHGDGVDTMFDDAVLVKDYIIEDYLASAIYAMAFKDNNNDGFPDINSEGSPLKKYSGYLLDYDTPYGSGRISIQDYSSEQAALNEKDSANHILSNPACWIVIALVICVAIITFIKKKCR